jgi:hypothetical protein
VEVLLVHVDRCGQSMKGNVPLLNLRPQSIDTLLDPRFDILF